MLAILFLITTSQVLALGARVCRKPVTPANGKIHCDREPLVPGKACYFGCNEDYELQGVREKRCLSDGRWSGPPTSCIALEEARCQPPPPLENGRVIGCSPTKLPRVSENCGFICNNGYVLTGPEFVTCTRSGRLTNINGEEVFPKCALFLEVHHERISDRHPETTDTDPCSKLNCEQMCVTWENPVRCGCRRGFILNQEDKRTCNRNEGKPIYPSNPCADKKGGCDHFCRLTKNGQVDCYCQPGFTVSGKKCIRGTKKPLYSQNLCHINNGGCDHYCSVSLQNEIFCSCRQGYVRADDDVKKCIRSPLPVYHPQITPAPVTCQINNGGCDHYCKIIQGTVQCECQEGYELHSDGKHCVALCLSRCQNGNCEQNECKCKPGWGGKFCDACIRYPGCQHGTCSQPYQCNCDPGWGGLLCNTCVPYPGCLHGTCSQPYQCNCDPGWGGLFCDQDINECLSDSLNNCQHYCNNTEGSYSCSCRHGFKLVDGHKCEGCGKNSYWSHELKGCTQCPENSHTDSEGKTSIKDCVCDSGFVGSPEGSCEDMNECLDNNFGCSHTCVNIPGSAYCNCPAGFQLDRNNKTCIDIDECLIKNGGCEGVCINLNGSFHCICLEGYVPSNKDHYSCNDVDECQDNNGGCEQLCINYRGGYYCACENGYRLDSSLKNCTVVQCPALPIPPYSIMRCKKNGEKLGELEYYPHGTKCNFTCKNGFKHSNNWKSMNCQEDGTWYGSLPECRAQNCKPLSMPENGAVHPSFCATQGNEVKQRCAFSCNPGYRLEGKPVLVCNNNLTWSYEVPACQLVKIQPRIECPPDIKATLKPGNNTYNITLQEPITNVQSYEVHPRWVSTGMPIEFPAGVTRVTFTAVSPNANKTAKCVTTITVWDEEPPEFEYCPDPIQIEEAGAEGAFVTWDEPVATDNVGIDYIFSISKPNTTFAPGTHVVVYIARDTSGNIASCSFDIHIIRVNCSYLDDPPHGKANCMDLMFGKLCQPECEDGYMRNPDDPIYYTCGDSGTWDPTDVIGECLKFIPAVSPNCPAGFTLKTNNETAEEVCVECPSNTLWTAGTQKCVERLR